MIGSGIGILGSEQSVATLFAARLSGMIFNYGDSAFVSGNYTFDFSLVQGNDLIVEIAVFDQTGDPFDLTDAVEIVWTARKDDDNDPAITKKMSSGTIELSTEALHKFVFIINQNESDEMIGFYIHEASIRLSNGYVLSIVLDNNLDYGRMVVRKKIATLS